MSKKLNCRPRRGVIGVESAIVMIAFVIVAAALAFVVLNMGFSTTQQAKTSIGTSLDEASTALEISGKVTGSGDVSAANLEVLSIPIKVAPGSGGVNLDDATATVKFSSNTVQFDNIYGSNCSLTSTTYTKVIEAVQAAVTSGCIDSNPINSTDPSTTKAVIYWTVNRGTQNEILDEGEHAVVAVVFSTSDTPSAYDKLKAEIITPTGSALTVERGVPVITTSVVDLG
jgi:archaeal flagellin FlaB